MPDPITLVPKSQRTDPAVRELLMQFVELADKGVITSVAIAADSADETVTGYAGDVLALVYALETLKLELLSDD
jgi:hypothetical protein